MFALSELTCLHEPSSGSKLLKPWWEVFMDCLLVLMLMLSVLAGTTLLLLASGSFWLHLPLTSARAEHFLAILANHHRHSVDSGTDSPLLGRAETQLGPTPPSVAPSLGPRSVTAAVEPPRQGAVTLDRSDSEQARALFERVRKFRAHCESSDVIYKVYVSQTLFKLLASALIVSLSAPLLGSMSFSHVCHPGDEGSLVGYGTFQCAHTLASLLHKLLLAYLLLLASYGLLNLYALAWIAHSPLRRYSFSKPWDPSSPLRDPSPLRDVPDLTNDLAFLLHMADQYDPLLAQRLSAFLSPVSETRLLEENLEQRWGPEELRSLVVADPEGGPRLSLVALPRLPPALYTLGHLRVLRLQLLASARLSGQVAAMASLRELHLDHCPLAVEAGALVFLQEHLEVLQLSFTQASELPGWVYSLRGLHQLHLSGQLGCCEGSGGRGWALGSLRQLRHLRVLVLRGALQRIPAELVEVAGSLAHLELHNEGCRLQPTAAALKRLAGLAKLRLRDCQLERLPGSLAALPRLRALDLGHNNLRSLEEPPGLLGQLRHLSSLTLAHNHLPVLPPSVGALRGLEVMDLAFNRLQTLPPALFTLPLLRRLLLGGNLLRTLPPAVAELRLLSELDVSENSLERLPARLFGCCSELRVLNVAHNALGQLPPAVGRLARLCRLDLRGNRLEELPPELASCPGLRGGGGGAGGGLVVEDRLLHSLPCWARDLLVQTSAPPPPRPLSGSLPSGPPSRPASETFPRYSTTQWNFHSALESRI
ncbi:hypothetical protein CRUP_011636 [Coryphaenoides rupestris]|nr:hypothetical protein CRUP_011636 [Coryphaenoides rupestris]